MATTLGHSLSTMVVGTDDLAEGDRAVLGFAPVAINREQLSKLNETAQSLLDRSGLAELHGSEFDPEHESYYGDFLAAIVEAMKCSRDSHFLVRYQSAPKFGDNLKFGQEMFSGARAHDDTPTGLGKRAGWRRPFRGC